MSKKIATNRAMSLKEVGEKLGISIEMVRRIEERALKKIRARYEFEQEELAKGRTHERKEVSA